MSGTTVMLIAWGALILGHWANGEPTISAGQVAKMVIAILMIAFLDSSPATEPIGKGLALIFLVAVLLSAKSVLEVIRPGGVFSGNPAPVKKK
jgi:hypothetical protein